MFWLIFCDSDLDTVTSQARFKMNCREYLCQLSDCMSKWKYIPLFKIPIKTDLEKNIVVQVRILLNKADEITAEELLKIQGNLVWNVSPLMASAEPPTLYAGSFWSKPYKVLVR